MGAFFMHSSWGTKDLPGSFLLMLKFVDGFFLCYRHLYFMGSSLCYINPDVIVDSLVL